MHSTLGVMASQTLARPSNPAEYQPLGPLNCLPLFPYLPGPAGYPTATAHRTHIDFIPNARGLNHADSIAACTGLSPRYPPIPYSNDIGFQTYFGPYPPICSPTSNNSHSPASYHGEYGMNQDASCNDWVPFTAIPAQQLAASYQTSVDHGRRQSFKFGHYIHPFQRIIDCGDFHGLDAEVKKLKEVWRVGVGIRRRRRKDKKAKTEEHSEDGITYISSKELGRSVLMEEPLSVNSEAPAGGLAHERTFEDMFNLGQDTPVKSSDTPSCFRSTIITDQLDEVIEALEEFERIELLPSPEVTPVRTKSTSKNTENKKPTMAAKAEHPPLIFGPDYRTQESPASRLPIPKETPKLKQETSSTSITKGVSSLRPPKAIARSSKPVTQPVPFKLVGETVSRKLRLNREQRRHSAGEQA